MQVRRKTELDEKRSRRLEMMKEVEHDENYNLFALMKTEGNDKKELRNKRKEQRRLERMKKKEMKETICAACMPISSLRCESWP